MGNSREAQPGLLGDTKSNRLICKDYAIIVPKEWASKIIKISWIIKLSIKRGHFASLYQYNLEGFIWQGDTGIDFG